MKKEIERLHQRNSSDWQGLVSQVGKNLKPRVVELNLLQATMDLLADRYQELYVEAGAGAGKSTGLARRMQRTVMELPRSANMLVGETYQQILTRTLPTTIHGLEMLGLFKDLHFFVGRKPPASWGFPEPYKPPLRSEKAIFFWTGACYNLVSQDVKGDGKSLNSDTLLADEATQLSKQQLDIDQRPRVRGSNHKEFDGKPLYLKELYVSTTATSEVGIWYEQMEELIEEQRVEIERKLRGNVSDEERKLLEKKLRQRKFIKATWEVNKKNLPDDYLEKAADSSLDQMMFEAEYLCRRPSRVRGGFYSLLNPDVHLYTDFDYSYYDLPGKAVNCMGDRDLVKGQPLILGVDWGGAINCLTTNQHLQSIKEYRTLKSMFVLGDKQEIQDDLFQNFHDYYRPHQASCPDLYMFYDNQGNQQTGITKRTRAERAAAQLRKLGWKVQLMTTGGRNENHELTFLTWQDLLRGDNPALPRYRMNRSNCKELFISMKNAPIKQDSRGVHKDKRSERSQKVSRQHATDLSDANDKPIIGLFSKLTARSSGFITSNIR